MTANFLITITQFDKTGSLSENFFSARKSEIQIPNSKLEAG